MLDSDRPVLVTGAAGFIGFCLARRLLEDGQSVVGLDSVNDYYDVTLKWARLEQLERYPAFSFHRLNLADGPGVEQLFRQYGFQRVVHLAAQAGVRYSLTNPHAYLESNLTGFLNILEACRHHHIGHLVFASSSSVYGANTTMPFSVHHNVDHPVSLYAASKKSNELMAHTYAHLFGLPCTGLRFFTVYGPWGRPDMALFLFTKAMLAGEPIRVFNHGRMERDFTYIDDIIEGVMRVTARAPQPDPDWNGAAPDPGTSCAPYHIYNIGNHHPVKLLDFIGALEECLGIKAKMEMLPMQPGDVAATCADIEDLARDFGFKPQTSVRDGIRQFVSWYRSYYKV
jgi:UDP-glucuronate 4-epimerase